MEEPGGLQSMGSRLSNFTFTFHFHALEKEMATHCSVLAWRIPGMAEPGGLPSMGLHRVGHDWSDLAAAVHSWELIMQVEMMLFASEQLFLIGWIWVSGGWLDFSILLLWLFPICSFYSPLKHNSPFSNSIVISWVKKKENFKYQNDLSGRNIGLEMFLIKCERYPYSNT